MQRDPSPGRQAVCISPSECTRFRQSCQSRPEHPGVSDPKPGLLLMMRLDELTQLGWGDAANYFRERDMRYGTAELKVPPVGKPQIDSTTATPSPITVGEHMQTTEIVRGQSEMLAVTSRPASSQMRLGSEKPQSHKFILVLSPGMATDSMPIEHANHVEPVSFYPCMKHP